MKNAEEKLSKAKAKLLVAQPAFGHIVSRLQFAKNDDIQNCISDGKSFEYNDEFIASCSEEELEFALSHAALHKILHHTNRKAKRATYLWQLATDYAVSSMLKESGYNLPDFARYQKRFDGLYAEEIYAILKDEIKNEEFSDDEELDTGFNEENKRQQKQQEHKPNNDSTQNDDYKMEAELEERLEQKFIEQLLEKFEEDMPEAIKRYLHIEPKSKINWRHELRRAIEYHAKNDYSLYPASKKLLYDGIYLPSLRSEDMSLAIAVDTSGSIDNELLDDFLSEVAYILLSIPSYTIEFLAVDDQVREHITLQKGMEFPSFVHGGCGTDFRVTFEHLHQKRITPKMLLYFTDLEGFFPKTAPNYEVVWVTRSEKEIPFGRKILLLES